MTHLQVSAETYRSGHQVSPITTGKPTLRDPLENCLLCKTNSRLTANSLSEHNTCKYINLSPYSFGFWLFYLMTSSFKIIENVLHWPLKLWPLISNISQSSSHFSKSSHLIASSELPSAQQSFLHQTFLQPLICLTLEAEQVTTLLPNPSLR